MNHLGSISKQKHYRVLMNIIHLGTCSYVNTMTIILIILIFVKYPVCVLKLRSSFHIISLQPTSNVSDAVKCKFN